MMKKTIIILLVLAVAFTAGGIFMKYDAYAMGFGGYSNEDQTEDFYNNRTLGRGHMGWYEDNYNNTGLSDEREEDLNVWPFQGYQYPNHPMWGYDEFRNNPDNEDFYNNRVLGRGHMGWYQDNYNNTGLSDEREEDLNVWPSGGYQYPNHPMWGYDEYRNNPDFEGFEEGQGYFRGCRGNFYRDGITE